MSSQIGASRPATKSTGAAVAGSLLTLAIMVVAMLAFLIAPLAALGLGYLGYVVMRSRGTKKQQPARAIGAGPSGPSARTDRGVAGFGAGTLP